MPIPSNVTSHHLQLGIRDTINDFLNDVPFSEESTRWCLVGTDRGIQWHLPPKAVIRRANAHANGELLWNFSGGPETNDYCTHLGFTIMDHGHAPHTVGTPPVGNRKTARTFGAIPNYPPGSLFTSRRELSDAGIHRPLQAGISGSSLDGADSIVLSGGYEDDKDFGDSIIYTGQGGNRDGRQIADQELTRGNLALTISHSMGLPVRVTRGAGHQSEWSPTDGYRYSGLFRVESHWHGTGQSGHRVYRFMLRRHIDSFESIEEGTETPEGNPNPTRGKATASRIIRDTKITQWVKTLYDFTCQVCGQRLNLPNGKAYSEGAHIRPLGSPHGGPDTPENVLCLCPNHHVLFDFGVFTLSSKNELIGIPGKLRIDNRHKIDSGCTRYHREHIWHE